MKIILKYLFLFFTSIALVLTIYFVCKYPSKNNYMIKHEKAPHKVILFIGDGMGENHIKNTEINFQKKMTFSSFPLQTKIATSSLNLFSPTDSAAAATALAGGVKVKNGEVAFHNNQYINSIMATATKNGMGTGIVTTDNLYGATPAAFSSHAKSRDNTDEIIKGQAISNINIMIGRGSNIYKNYKSLFENNGYTVENILEAASYQGKIISTFDEIGYKNINTLSPSLGELTKKAINFLEEGFGDIGYILMIEGAHIDKMSHKNNLFEMMNYLNDFNNAVEIALDMTKNDTTIIVTSDHETGGLRFQKEKDLLIDDLYTKTSHTTSDVYLFINDKTKRLKPIKESRIDNTDVYRICKALLNI